MAKNKEEIDNSYGWVKTWIARGILGTMGLGLWHFISTAYQDIADLKAHDIVQMNNYNVIKSDVQAIKENVNRIHWYMIERTNAKLPERLMEKKEPVLGSPPP